jgi:hypothetical protein
MEGGLWHHGIQWLSEGHVGTITNTSPSTSSIVIGGITYQRGSFVGQRGIFACFQVRRYESGSTDYTRVSTGAGTSYTRTRNSTVSYSRNFVGNYTRNLYYTRARPATLYYTRTSTANYTRNSTYTRATQINFTRNSTYTTDSTTAFPREIYLSSSCIRRIPSIIGCTSSSVV